MAKRRTNQTRWLLGTILIGALVIAVLVGAMRCHGVEEVRVTQDGITITHVHALLPSERNAFPDYNKCGVTVWHGRFGRMGRVYRQAGVAM